jgi:hypothetical protein
VEVGRARRLWQCLMCSLGSIVVWQGMVSRQVKTIFFSFCMFYGWVALQCLCWCADEQGGTGAGTCIIPTKVRALCVVIWLVTVIVCMGVRLLCSRRVFLRVCDFCAKDVLRCDKFFRNAIRACCWSHAGDAGTPRWRQKVRVKFNLQLAARCVVRTTPDFAFYFRFHLSPSPSHAHPHGCPTVIS